MTTARADRRRRILQDGGSAAVSPAADTGQPASKVRYTPRDGSASFAVAAGVVPRSTGALLGLFVAMAAVIAGLAWADGFGLAIATTDANQAVARLLMIDQPASLASAWSGSIWLGLAAQSLLLFGLRRHRTNDLRGGYRWWLLVAAVAACMSAAVATHAHAAVATTLVAATGFAPLGDGAFWWLAPAVLVLGGVALRCFFEMKESPMASLVGALAVATALVGWTVGVGLVPSVVAGAAPWLVSPLVAPVAQMAAASLALIALLLYSRRIVLEAEGAIAPPAEKPAETKTAKEPKKPARRAKPKIADATVEEPEPAPAAPKPRSKPAAKPAAAAKESKQAEWVDGGEGYSDEYDEGPQRRRLSKAERKRLRKLKARRAA